MVTTRGKSEVDVHQDNMASTRTTRSSDKSNANSNNASPAKKKQETRSVLKEGTRNSPASPVRRRSTRRSPRNSKDEDLSDDADMRGNFEAAEVSQEDKENRKKSSSPSSKRGVPAEAHGDSPSKRRKPDESEQKEEALGEDKGLNEFEGSDMDEDEEELFTSRSSAASTAKRGSGYDNEELVDLCVKVLTQGCGLHTGTPLLLAEARSNHEQQNTTEDDQDQQEEEEDEEAVYAGFASSLVGQLTSEGNTEGSNPAFLLFGKRSKTLEKNFVHFWNQLVTLMHGKETLYSDSQGVDFLTCMRHVCVELSKSEVRAFRYAACVCGYAILGSLAQVHQVLSETNVLLTKQLRATDSRNKGQRKDINKRMQVCHERTNIVDINMKTLFQELVIVRFRDVAPQVRALTIQWVGTWVVLHPQKFLSDGYLKYVAWSLNDKDAHVRVSAVDALKKVYQKHAVSTDGTTSATEGGASGAGSFSNFSALDLLTQRFHGRFTELIRDNDEQVCVNALELVVCLAKAGLVDVHSKEIDSNVALLLLDKSDKVRVNAGKLAACMVDQRLSKKQKRASNKRRGSKSSQEKENKTGDNKTGDCIEVCKILCKLVVEGLPESVVERSWDQLHNSPSSILTGEEEVFVGAITAVIPHLSPDLIHDWDVLAEACKTRKGANSSEETLVNVVRVVLAAIRHFTSPKMIRQSLTKRTSRSAIVDLCEMSQQKFTLSFMRVLSILLAQCKSKVGLVFNRLSCLLSALCSKMKQELFVAKRDSEKDFESIVQSLHDLCLKTNSTHIDSMQEDTPETLDTHVMSCLRCLMSLDKSGAAVTREKAQKKLKDILEGLLKDAVKVMGLINGKELAPAKAGKKSKRSKRSSKGMYDMSSLDEDAVFKLRSHLHRVHALQQLGVFQPASVSEEKGETLDTVFFDSLQDLIGQCCDLDDEDYMLEHSTMQMACLNIFDSLLWKLQGIQQEIPDSLDVLDTFTKDRIVILLDMLQKFVNQLETLYSLYPTSEGLQKTIYTIILDLTFSFQKCAAKWTAKIEEEDLKEEILEKVVPGTEVFKVLWDFCKKECFDVLLDKKKDAKGDDDNTNELVAAQNVLSPLLRLLTSGNALSSPGSLWLVPELFSYTSIANKIVSNALKKLWQSTHLMETSLEHADGSHDSRRLTTEDKIKMYVRGLKVAYLRWKDSDMNADRLALNQLCTFIGRHHKKNPTVLLGMLELAIGNDEEEENGESAALEPMELVNEVLVQYIDKLDEGDVKKLAKVVSKSTGKQHLQELYQLLQEMDPEISDDDYEEHSEDDDGGEQDQDKVHQMEEDNEEDEGKEEIPPPPPRSTRRRL